MSDKYLVPRHLDDPELIGLWTLDEFLAMAVPFIWGVLGKHIIIGLVLAVVAWWAFRKAKAGRASTWVFHACYWYLPGLVALRVTPPSFCRLLAG